VIPAEPPDQVELPGRIQPRKQPAERVAEAPAETAPPAEQEEAEKATAVATATPPAEVDAEPEVDSAAGLQTIVEEAVIEEPAAQEPDIPAPTAADIDPEVALALGVTVIESEAPRAYTNGALAPPVEVEVTEPEVEITEPEVEEPPPPFDTPRTVVEPVEPEVTSEELEAPAAEPGAPEPAAAALEVDAPEIEAPTLAEPAPRVQPAPTIERAPRPAPAPAPFRQGLSARVKFDIALVALVALVAAGFGISRLFNRGPAAPSPVTIGAPYVGALQGITVADGGPGTTVDITYEVLKLSRSLTTLNITAAGANLSMATAYRIDTGGVKLTQSSTGTELGAIVVNCPSTLLMDPSPLRSGSWFQMRATCQVSAPDGSSFSRVYKGSGTVASLQQARFNGRRVATATLRYSLTFRQLLPDHTTQTGTQSEIDVIQINPFIVLSASTTTTLETATGPQTRNTIFWIDGFRAA